MVKEIKISEENQKLLKQIDSQISELQKQAKLIILAILNQESVDTNDYDLEITPDYSKIIVKIKDGDNDGE